MIFLVASIERMIRLFMVSTVFCFTLYEYPWLSK